MACNLTAGRNLECKDSVGGIKSVYFINSATGTTFVLSGTTGKIGAISSGSTAYQYNLKGANTYTETITVSAELGTTFYNQVLSMNLNKLSAEQHLQLQLLAHGRPYVIVHFNNGESIVMGYENGVDLTTATINVGAGLGEAYGYTVELTGMEKNFAYFLAGSTVADPFTGLTTKPTIVTGTN